ncbi:MAG: glycerophosphodiester phosphodiesterase, partial [Candidatus Hydrogenedentes bacterium]|nr:glycerophosphodiester phosphodiesterase [Candidatus Hydrogenedentota bacterium]
RTEFLVSKDKERPERWDQLLAFGRLIGVAGFNAHHEAITPELIESAHRKGRSVAAWTVDDPVEMQRLAGWGIDAIITNKPDVALETLRGLRVHP